MKQNNRQLAKIVWVFLCVMVLMVTLYKFDHRPDSDISDFLIWSMLILSAPSGVFVLLLNASLAYMLYSALAITIPSTYLTLGVTWLLYFIIGYFQWFCLLPRIAAKKRASTGK